VKFKTVQIKRIRAGEDKAVGRKDCFGGVGAIRKLRPRNSTNKPPFILYQWRIRRLISREP